MSFRRIGAFIVVFAVEIFLEIFLSMFTDNVYLIYLIVDIVAAFLFAIIDMPGKKSDFLKDPYFHLIFSSSLIFFVGITLLFSVLKLI